MPRGKAYEAVQGMLRAMHPREDRFYDLFAESSANVKHGAELLADLMNDYRNVQEKVAAIEAAEHEGDRITQAILRELASSFVTPFDRGDIAELAQCLDNVLDLCEAVAARVQWFEIEKPTDSAVRLANILAECAGEIDAMVSDLRNLHKDKEEHWRNVNSLENQADDIERAALAAELQRAKQLIGGDDWRDFAMAMIEANQWRELYERLEAATDNCEDAANVLETMATKYA
ncbi:MAG: DUF47 domain-containing protein [Armatimonadota bacterium]